MTVNLDWVHESYSRFYSALSHSLLLLLLLLFFSARFVLLMKKSESQFNFSRWHHYRILSIVQKSYCLLDDWLCVFFWGGIEWKSIMKKLHFYGIIWYFFPPHSRTIRALLAEIARFFMENWGFCWTKKQNVNICECSSLLLATQCTLDISLSWKKKEIFQKGCINLTKFSIQRQGAVNNQHKKAVTDDDD